MFSVQSVTSLVHQEAANLDNRRKLSVPFKEMRHYFKTHPTSLNNMIHHARPDSLALMFLTGCKSPLVRDEYIQMLGCAVFAELPHIVKLQRIIFLISRSYIYEIGELAHVHRTTSKSGAVVFDIASAWPQISVTDVDLVQQEADVIFTEVQELAELMCGSSETVTDFVWWSLSPWLASVIAVCCAARLDIDPKYSAVINNIPRIVTGDYPAKALTKQFAHHSLTRLNFSRK